MGDVMIRFLQSSPFRRLGQSRKYLSYTTVNLQRHGDDGNERLFNVPKYQIVLKQAPTVREFFDLDAYDDEFYDSGYSNTSSLFETESLPGAAPTIPADVPTLPLIASQTPIFPKFIRIIEIADPAVMELIMKNVELKFPYAAIFCRTNDSVESSAIEDEDEIYKTGTFIHIQELVPIKNSLRLLVQGVRRIAYNGPNQERNGEDEHIAWCNVSNKSETFKQNNNTKALCAEIIQSCRDLIQINQLYRESVHQILSQGVRVVVKLGARGGECREAAGTGLGADQEGAANEQDATRQDQEGASRAHAPRAAQGD